MPNLDYNNLLDKKIFIPQYPKRKQLSNSKGEIIAINDYEITHTASIDYGSSGSPIILNNTNQVIGIHKAGSKNENYGDFIYPVMNMLKNTKKQKS